MPTILGFGNPLLDLTISTTPARMAALGVAAGTHANQLPELTKERVLAEVLTEPATILSAGGSALNTLRTVQWLLGRTHLPHPGWFVALPPGMRVECSMMGAVGDDPAGRLLVAAAVADGVGVEWLQLAPRGMCTGQCCCLHGARMF
jgi:sugar/nucleoside kinase (ribokinase family)